MDERLLYLLLAILLIFFGFTPISSKMRSLAKSVSAPFLVGTFDIAQRLSYEADYLLNLKDIRKENKELKEKVRNLHNRLVVLEEVKRENTVLKEQLDLAGEGKAPKMVLGKVFGSGLSLPGNSANIMINKGSNAGISKGDIAVIGNFLVGEVVSLDDSSSVIKTILSGDIKIASLTQKSRVSGIASGFFSTKIEMERVLQKDRILEGEVVITSGIDGRFPKGFIVGEVEKIEGREEDVEKKVIIRPLVQINRLEEVFILVD